MTTKKLFPILTMLICVLCISAFVFCISPTAVHAEDTHTHDGVTFEAWTETDSLPTSGSYYLTSDVNFSGQLTLSEELHLCLNGYDILLDSLIKIDNSVTMNLYDCNDSGVISSSAQSSSVLYLNERAILNVYGGIIDGSASNRGIYVPVNGKLNMYGGIIRNGTADCGGGVYCRGTFTMYGGEIKNNHVKADASYNTASGGGVYLGVYGSLTMYDGFITNNTAVNNDGYDSLGGGICVEGYEGYNYNEIHLYGGEISGNSADIGGGIYLYRGILYTENESLEVNVTQPLLIKNNTARKNGGGIAGLMGSVYINNAIIEGNTATTGSGGGVYVLSKLVLTNSTVRNNKSGSGDFSGAISGTTALGGLVTIEDNTTGDGKKANLPWGDTTLLEEGLNTNSRIGINSASLRIVRSEEITLIAADASIYEDVFFSDDELCSVYLAEDNSLRFGYIHRDHVWADTYSRNESEHWYECLCEDENCQMLTRVSGNQYKKGYGTHDDLASCMFCDPNLHYHRVCAEEICTHDGYTHDSSVRYIAITMENYDEILELTTNVFDDKIYTFPSGSYYLAEDITIPDGYYLNTTTGGTVNLCLAGYSLSVNSNSTYTPYAIDISESSTFTVCDCSTEETGKIVSAIREVIRVESKSTLNIYGGTLQLISSASNVAYGICGSVNDSFLNFYRGQINVSSSGDIVAVSSKGGVLVYDLEAELVSTNSTANIADFDVWAKAVGGFTLISDNDHSFNVLELSDTVYTTIDLSGHTGAATFNTSPVHDRYICVGKAFNVIIANEGWGAAVKTVNTKQYVTIVHIAHSGGTATCTEKAECSVCGTAYGDTLAHTPDEDDGSCLTEVLCSICNVVATEAKNDHSFDNSCDTTCGNKGCTHTREITHTPRADDGDCTTAIHCAVCDAMTTPGNPSHDFDSACDTDCNRTGCNHTRKAPHTPEADDGNCLTEVLCSICNVVATEAKNDHSLDNSCDTTCGNEGCTYTREITHTPRDDDGDCTTAIHCAVCDAMTTPGNPSHDFDNTCDTDCSRTGCDHIRTITHTPDEDDGNCLTEVRCSICNAVATPANATHTGGTATCQAQANCSICGTAYGETNANNHSKTTFVYTVNADGTTHTKKYECCVEIALDSEAHSYGADNKCVCGAEKPIPTYTVTVENGTARDGDTSIVVNENGSVTVTANAAPEGKQFKGWSVGGEIVSTDETYTFNATYDIELEAVYEDVSSGSEDTPSTGEDDPFTGENDPSTGDSDIPPVEPGDDEELSDGAITVIVISSVAALSGGGFALWWFVFKKKKI